MPAAHRHRFDPARRARRPIPARLARARIPAAGAAAARTARLAVTHGGNNSVTESVGYGVPLLVLPFSTDQFAGAAAIERVGHRPGPRPERRDRRRARRCAHRGARPRGHAAAAARSQHDQAERPGPAIAYELLTDPRARHELTHGDWVALGGTVALHECRVGLVTASPARTSRGVVQGVDPALVPHRRPTEQGAVCEVPRRVLEPPAAEPLVLTAVARPRARRGHVDARARADHQLVFALLRRRSGAQLRVAGAAQPAVLGVGQVHESARARGGDGRAQRRGFRQRVGVAYDDDLVGVGGGDAEVAAGREHEDVVVGVDGLDRELGQSAVRTSRARIRTPARAREPAARARSP